MLNLVQIADRGSFNLFSRQIRKTLSVIDQIENSPHLKISDFLEPLSSKLMIHDFLAILGVIREKFNFQSISFNLGLDFCSVEDLQRVIQSLVKFDFFIIYHHQNQEFSFINSAKGVIKFKKNRLVVFYLRAPDSKLCSKLLENIKAVLIKEKPFIPSDFQGFYELKKFDQNHSPQKDSVLQNNALGTIATENSGPITDSASKKSSLKVSDTSLKDGNTLQNNQLSPVVEEQKIVRKSSPLYGVQVTNELFHNGNVEAWKNIIESYAYKYPDLRVLVYHKGERVVNLNSLFKWGKVRHGEAIEFKVVGDFKDLAKLKKYLYEGASNRFEKFLAKEINSYLNLF